MPLKKKRIGLGLEMKTFAGDGGNSYLALRTGAGSYHVFMEVEAKEAARRCGAKTEGNTRAMWASVWKSH